MVKQVIIIRKNFPDGKGGVKSMRRGKEIDKFTKHLKLY